MICKTDNTKYPAKIRIKKWYNGYLTPLSTLIRIQGATLAELTIKINF